MPICRGDDELAGSGQEFLFDALSCTVFGEADSTRIYKPHTPKTRAWLTVTTCWDVHTGGGSEKLTYRYTECTDKTTWVDTVLKWHSQPDLPGSGGSIYIGGGSGGNTGTGGLSARGIFTNSRFLEDDWKIAQELLDMIMDDCLGNSLITGIKNSFGDSKIKLQYTEEEGASYNLITNTLSIGIGNLESNQAFHELWHAYQVSRGTTASFGSSGLNQEIEAHYAQYVYLKGKSYYSGSVYEKRYTSSRSRGTAIANLDRYIDKKGNLLSSVEDYDILLDTYIEATIIPVFRMTPDYSSYPYDPNKSGISIFSNLKTLTKNCN